MKAPRCISVFYFSMAPGCLLIAYHITGSRFHFSLSENDVHEDGAKALSRALGHCSQLQKLE